MLSLEYMRSLKQWADSQVTASVIFKSLARVWLAAILKGGQ